MPTIDVNGRSLHYTDAGHGQAILLIHGFPLDGRIWAGVAERLVAKARVIVPDLRGFGRHTPEDAFTMADLADDMAAMMEMLGIAPCPVAGLSMGGYVAQTLAKKYPGIASRLILVDTKAEGDSAEGKAKRDAMAEVALAEGSKAIADQMLPNMTAAEPNPAVAAELRSIMESQPPKTLAAACGAMRDREDFTDFLTAIEVPVAFIFGRDDKISPSAAIEKYAAGGNTLTLIDNAGHMSPIEQPQAVADAIAKNL
ncbi:MAG: alpha/beta hydrolase fold [Phycisphaerales bacterium]|nr:alpha/beta hydrolase fold [Phycisphaerales bacterium]